VPVYRPSRQGWYIVSCGDMGDHLPHLAIEVFAVDEGDDATPRVLPDMEDDEDEVPQPRHNLTPMLLGGYETAEGGLRVVVRAGSDLVVLDGDTGREVRRLGRSFAQ
jgi:hypothetical protein